MISANRRRNSGSVAAGFLRLNPANDKAKIPWFNDRVSSSFRQAGTLRACLLKNASVSGVVSVNAVRFMGGDIVVPVSDPFLFLIRY